MDIDTVLQSLEQRVTELEKRVQEVKQIIDQGYVKLDGETNAPVS